MNNNAQVPTAAQHPPHSGTAHLWRSGNERELAVYYAFGALFLCPTCELILADLDELKTHHRNAGPFSRLPKRNLYLDLKRKRRFSERALSKVSCEMRVKKRTRPSTVQQQLPSRYQAAVSTMTVRPQSSSSSAHSTTLPPTSSQVGYGPVDDQVRDLPFYISARTNLRRAHITVEVELHMTVQSAAAFIDNYIDIMAEAVSRELDPQLSYKLQVDAVCTYVKLVATEDDEEPRSEKKTWHCSVRAQHFSGERELRELLLESGALLDDKLEQYSNTGSNWRIESIETLAFILHQHNPLTHLVGSSYIPTPSYVANKKCCINVKNKQDPLCFVYSILAVLKREELESQLEGNQRNAHLDRPNKYEPYMDELSYNAERDMPMRLCNIPKFERQNPHVAINVIKYLDGIDEQQQHHHDTAAAAEAYTNPHFDLVYKSKYYTDESREHIYLLLVEDIENDNFHYIGITSLDRLLNQNRRRGIQINRKWCPECLSGWTNQAAFDKHLPLCHSRKIGATVYTMPKEKQLLFSDQAKSIPPAFAVYADFESVLKRPETADEAAAAAAAGQRQTLQTHEPISAGLVLIKTSKGSAQPTTIPPQYESFYGPNCVVDFLLALKRISADVAQWYKANANHRMIITREQTRAYEIATHCYVCHTDFNGTVKVRDHDHFTGTYLGAACNQCNLARRKRKPFLPVVFHNLRGYDMHHILKYALNKFPDWDLNVIAQSSERFQALMIYFDVKEVVLPLRFIDSLQFLGTSLNNLVSMLPQLPITEQYLIEVPDVAKRSKGIFPYSYCDTQQKLDEPRVELPSRNYFYDELSQSVNVSETEYEVAKLVWRETRCSSLKDFMMIYLKLDVYLLADVFEAFRKTALSEDGLDPLHFFSIPGLSWSAALKSLPACGLELLQDAEQYKFFESGIRGGMTFVNKHYVKRDDNTQLLYVDVNNLYGWALSQHLPCSDFEWVTDREEMQRIARNLPYEDADYGYLLEVDLVITDDLHEELADLPPAPTREKPPGSKTEKLLMTLEEKHHYVLHSALLKFYIENMGVAIIEVHRVIKFKQAPVFRNFITVNTRKRAATTEKFLKDYYKLKNNALYGKTVENLRKRSDLRLCNTQKKLVTYTSKPTFKRSCEITKDLVAAMLSKDIICLNRPVYIGQAVLDLSKLRMYRLQYEELWQYRGEFRGCEINIVAGDTDSFFLEVKDVDCLTELLPAMQRDGLLDTSNYDPASPLFSRQNENKVGLIKDESGGKVTFTEWVFLRPKCYSMLTETGRSQHRAKGVTRSTELTHQQYLEVYHSYRPNDDEAPAPKRLCVDQRSIRSENHQLKTLKYSKVALSVMDDKRQWIDQNKSLPYGHHDLVIQILRGN